MTSQSKLVILLIIVLAAAAILVVPTLIPESGETIRIGGKNFTEQSVLAEIMAQMIEAHTDLNVDRKLYLGGTMVCFNALEAGDLALYPEYTGTGLVSILDRPSQSDPNVVLQTVREAFAEQYDLVWLEPLGFNNTYTLTMRADHAKQLGIETYSDLAEHMQQRRRSGEGEALTAGFTGEFLDRPDGYKGLIETYDMEFESRPKQLEEGIMYKACSDGDVDVICGFATDGRIAAYGLVTLTDDKNYFPPYQAAPLVRSDVLEAYPQLREPLERLGGTIDDATMQELNYAVDRDERSKTAKAVAREFLRSEGLISE